MIKLNKLWIAISHANSFNETGVVNMEANIKNTIYITGYDGLLITVIK